MTSRLDAAIISERRLADFLAPALADLSPLPECSHACPHCGLQVRYPLAVAEGDLKAMQVLIKAVGKWLDKSGATADAWAEIMAIAKVEMIRRSSTRSDK